MHEGKLATGEVAGAFVNPKRLFVSLWNRVVLQRRSIGRISLLVSCLLFASPLLCCTPLSSRSLEFDAVPQYYAILL